MASQSTLDSRIACVTSNQVMEWIAKAVTNVSNLPITSEIFAIAFTAAFNTKTTPYELGM